MNNHVPIQPNNPSSLQRHTLLKYTLALQNREEDYKNIISLLSPPPDITTIATSGSCKHIRVAILGAGLAGLSAAYELRKLGFDITIFEAEKNRIGGRVLTHYFDSQGQLYGELGPMRIPVSHEITWHYLNTFNLTTRPFIQTNENTFRYVRGVRVRNNPEAVQKWIYPNFPLTPDERNTLWPELQAQVFEDYLLSMPPEIRREIIEIKDIYSPEILKADYYNIRQMMEIMGLSDGAIEMLSAVDPFVGDFLYNSFFEILQELYPASFAFMYEIIGGFCKLPQAFYHSLNSNSSIAYGGRIPQDSLGKITWRLGHQITGLSHKNIGDSVSLDYKNLNSLTTGCDNFDFVVCTIPFSNLRLMELCPQFSSKKMDAIRMLNYESSQKTLLLCNRRFWEEGPPSEKITGGGSATDLVISSIWYPSDHSKYIPNQKTTRKIGCCESPPLHWGANKHLSPHLPGVLLASYNYTQDAIRLGNFKEEDIPEIVKRQVEEIHGLPKFYLDSIVIDHKTLLWNNHPWALGGFAFYNPQQKRLYSKVATEPEYGNRVFFAGEHISVTRAWIQGALQTGMKAANDIAEACVKYI